MQATRHITVLRLILILSALMLLPGKMLGQVMHVDGILGIVGDKVILRSDFETEKAQLTRGGAVADTSIFNCLLMRKLIMRKLMLNRAEIDSLPISDERVESEIESRLRYFQRQAGSQEELERYLGKTLAEYKEEIRPKMKEQILAQDMEAKITANVKISPQEVKLFYDSIPRDSLPMIPAEVEVAQLVIEPPIAPEAKEFAKEQLESIRLRIMRGESFEKLARFYSMDPGSKDNNGLLPEFGRGEMVAEFERMAFKLKKDSISPVFESSFGYHIMKVIQRKGERVLAAHILIRPEHVSTDLMIARNRMDSVFSLLYEKKIDWCTAVKRYASNDLGNRGYCGFYTDETTGSQKMLFEELPSDIKLAVDKMSPGDYSEPVKTFTPDGRVIYRMIYLKSLTAPHIANLKEDYSRIQIEAEAVKKQKTVDSWVKKQLKTTYLRINQGYISCPDLKTWENQN